MSTSMALRQKNQARHCGRPCTASPALVSFSWASHVCKLSNFFGFDHQLLHGFSTIVQRLAAPHGPPKRVEGLADLGPLGITGHRQKGSGPIHDEGPTEAAVRKKGFCCFLTSPSLLAATQNLLLELGGQYFHE